MKEETKMMITGIEAVERLTAEGIHDSTINTPLTISIQGTTPRGSRLARAWRGFMKREGNIARPLVISGNVFYGSRYVGSWRQRFRVAWRCLRGWVPADTDMLKIEYPDEPPVSRMSAAISSKDLV